MKLHLFFLSITAIVMACSNNAFALKSDKDQPVDIQADDITFDLKKGLRTYIGNVIIIQGTLRIKADKIVMMYKGSDLQKAVATGSLARFKQRPDGKEQDVEGFAKKIIVDQKNNLLTLNGQASLRQGSDTARGEKIIYNMANNTLNIKGGSDGSATIDANNQNKPSTPKKRLEDPFKDDPIAPDEKKTSTSNEKNTPAAPAKAEHAPTKSGRSRLIIKPKKKQ